MTWTWDPSSVVSLITLLGVVVMGGRLYEQLKRLNELHPSKDGCVGQRVEHKVEVLSTQIGVFWNAMSGAAADMLRQHTKPRRDLLADKLRHGSLTYPEVEELITLLKNDLIEEETEPVMTTQLNILMSHAEAIRTGFEKQKVASA